MKRLSIWLAMTAVICSAMTVSGAEQADDGFTAADEEIYSPVIGQYKNAAANGLYTEELRKLGGGSDTVKEYLKEKGEYLDASVFYTAVTYNNRSPEMISEDNREFYSCYAFTDINNDGINELCIGAGTAPDDIRVYNIFSYDGEKPVPLFEINSIEWRDRLHVYSDNQLCVTDSQGLKNEFYFLPEKAVRPVLNESYVVNYQQKAVDHLDSEGKMIETISQETFSFWQSRLENREFLWVMFDGSDNPADGESGEAQAEREIPVCTEENIQYIRDKFYYITDHVDSFECINSEPGVEEYYENGELRKVRVYTGYGTPDDCNKEYYYWDNKLFFIFTWRDDGSDENRLYYKDDVCIRYIPPTGEVYDNPDFSSQEFYGLGFYVGYALEWINP